MSETKYCIPRVKGSQLSCTLVGVLGVLFNLRGVAILLHGTVGCAHFGLRFCEHMFLRENEILPRFQFPSVRFRATGLSEEELIFGGETVLRQKIEDALAEFPEVPLLVVPSCTVEVIGDDVDGICREMSAATGRRIVYLKMGGFLGGDHYQGLNTVYTDLINHFLTPADAVDPHGVNLVAERGLSAVADIEAREITRLLSRLGLTVNCRFIRNFHRKDFPRVTRAALNLPCVHNQTIAVCRHLEKKFGMPYIAEGFPSGFADLQTWLAAISERLNLDADAEALAAAERDFFLQEIHRLGNPLQGLRVVLNTIPMNVHWLVEFLELTGAELMEVNILQSAYFQSDFVDRIGRFDCPVRTDMRVEDILQNNRESGADLYLQCAIHSSPLPVLQPGLLVKEVPVLPPVGPRGLLNLFVNWAQWLYNPQTEGWRRENVL